MAATMPTPAADDRRRARWQELTRAECFELLAVEVTDRAELARLRALPLQVWAPGSRGHYIRILPAALAGRRIAAPGRAP
jgi:hypothetical protein